MARHRTLVQRFEDESKNIHNACQHATAVNGTSPCARTFADIQKAPYFAFAKAGRIVRRKGHSAAASNLLRRNLPRLILRNIVLRVRELVDSVTDSAATAALPGEYQREPERLGEPLAGELAGLLCLENRTALKHRRYHDARLPGLPPKSFLEAKGCRQL